MHSIILSGLWDWIPSRTLGPYLLRHRIEKKGYTCQVIDHCQEFTSDDIINLIEHFITDKTVCLGLSSTFWQDIEQKFWDNDNGMPPNLYPVTKYIKEKYPKIKIIVGGAGVRYLSKQIDYVDGFVVGEAEDIFPELIEHYVLNSTPPSFIIHEINKKPYYNKPLQKTYQIETCDFMFSDNDAILSGEALPVEAARGCIFKCKFCAYPHLGKKKFDYLKGYQTLHDHFMRNYEKWNITNYLIMDDTFNDSEHKVNEFLELTKNLPFKLNYTAYIRADLLYTYDGQAEKLQESGLDGAVFGIESLHPKASLVVGKGWSGKHGKEFLPKLIHNTWGNKVNVHMGFIAGLPGETREDLLETLKWLNDNKLHASWSALQIQTVNNLASKTLESVSFLSEFDRNSLAYGYKFDKNGVWYNDYWTFNEAVEFRADLNQKRKISRLNPWIAQQAKKLGYSMHDLINQKVRGKYFMLQPEFIQRKNNYIQEYKEKLLSLNNQ